MAPLSHLNTLLSSVVNAGFVNDEQELFDLLTTHRLTLVKLLDFGIPNEAERKELQGGKITLEKTEFTLSSSLATQVIFLAQTLECSERHVASLVHYVMTTEPNVTPTALLEAVVSEHHLRRRDVVSCVGYLLDICMICSTPNRAPDRTSTHSQIEQFVVRSLPDIGSKIWSGIEKMEQEISRAQNAVQNAGSETIIQGDNTRLGQSILSARLQSLQMERRQLALNLYLVACLGELTISDLEKIVPWLQQSPRHPLAYHVLTILLVTFDAVDPSSPGATLRHKLATDPATVKLMKARLSPLADWKDTGLKSVVLLKWPLFMTEILRREPSLEKKDGFQTDQLEENVWRAIEGSAFGYLSSAVAHLQRKEGTLPLSYTPSSIQSEAETLPELPSDDFKLAVLQAFETLVRLLIRHASSVVKKIKLRQEDHILATAPNRSRMFLSTVARSELPGAHASPPRHDIAKFVAFIGNLYSILPSERALQFWAGSGLPDTHRPSYLESSEASSASSGKLSSFLQWVIWSTRAEDIDMCIALYKMLAGLANGQLCSELALNFLGRNTGEVAAGNAMPGRQETVASWTRMFAQFEAWATPTPAARPTPQTSPPSGFMTGSQLHHQPQQPTSMSLKEMELGQGYLRLIEVIASHSAPCRLALTGDPRFRILPTLVSIVPLGRAFGIPLELKGSVFRTLAALCAPGAGSQGVEICRQMWGMLERTDIINVRSSGVLAKKGVQDDLERVEEPSGMYPATVPFLSLLSALIHTPKQLSLRARITDQESVNTVPENLGQPYRQPGIQPYIAFVVDEVFLRIPNREYQIPRERWLMNECCLAFIERCLASYDLEAFLTAVEANQIQPESLSQLTAHPGYDLLQRLLTSSPLQMSILGYLVDGIDGLDKKLDEEEPLFARVITRVLRIVHRVLEIQDIFLDVLVPLLLELRDLPVSGQMHPRSFYISLDTAISFGSSYAPAIGAYVTFTSTRAELGILSIKILSTLAKSSAFTSLTTLLERSSESERIIDGYRRILDIDSLDDPDIAEQDADRCTGAGAPDLEADSIPLTLLQATRLSVLSLLSQNTTPGSAYPNVAHLILFGSTSMTTIQGSRALGARPAGIHTIMEKVNAGVPRLDRTGRALEHIPQQQHHPLFATLPELAERFYRVLYNLCIHSRTSESAIRYLRLNEDFFARQLTAISFQAPPTDLPTIEVRYPDGARVTTTVLAFTAFLRLRSYIFDLVALDLHAVTRRGDRKAAGVLLEIIYGNEAQYADADWIDDIFGRTPFRERGQSNMRAVEYAQSLSFDWINSLAVTPQPLELLATLDLAACLRVDDKGCEIVDKDVLLVLLAHAQRAAQARGRITAPGDLDRLAVEKHYIIESAVVENQRREVAFARAKGFEAWRRMIDMTLVKGSEQLPRATRETVLTDVLDELPPIIRSDAIEMQTAVLLAEVAVALVTKLREERARQRAVQLDGPVDTSGLSAERMQALLRAIVECVLDHRAELVRGNLYATLINYFHLLTPAAVEPTPSGDELALSKSTLNLSLSLLASTTERRSVSAAPTGGDASATTAVLKPFMDRLVATVARDASDGTEVWRSVAFVLLDALMRLARADALTVLSRRGFLATFVRGIQDADRWLLAVLKPDPDDLNALYVYEANMSLLVRIAQSRMGAERLLDARAIAVLAECDFIDAQPEADQAFIDKGGFLPSAIERYHQMLLPALQLVSAILATLGQGHKTAAAQALEFLNAHRDTIAILLKNDADEIPLTLLKEIHLLATISGAALPKVERHEFMSTNTGFGSIHSALLSLTAKALGGSELSQRVRPQNDTEVADTGVNAAGYANTSKFDLAVQDTEQTLRKALIAYAGTASEFTETDITLVLSPILSAPRQHGTVTRVIATVPTVSDALDALGELADTLGEQLIHIANIDAELSARDLIRVEDVQEILPLAERALLDELDVGQKRALICAELSRIQTAFKTRAATVLASLEMLLLILWRHVTLYAEGRHIGNVALRTAAPGVVRALQAADVEPETFVRDAARRAGPVLVRLDALDLETVDPALGTNQAFLNILTGKLRDVLGIALENDGAVGGFGR